MSFLRNLVVVATITLGGLASAETVQYGSLRHYSDVPSVLFLTGEIKVNDSFELRRAMRDQTIDLVVMASPGGNLYEGLQIAAIIVSAPMCPREQAASPRAPIFFSEAFTGLSSGN